MSKYPVVFTYGYALTPMRRDYRITLEGLAIHEEGMTDEIKRAFLEFCKDATELQTESGNGLLKLVGLIVESNLYQWTAAAQQARCLPFLLSGILPLFLYF